MNNHYNEFASLSFFIPAESQTSGDGALLSGRGLGTVVWNAFGRPGCALPVPSPRTADFIYMYMNEASASRGVLFVRKFFFIKIAYESFNNLFFPAEFFTTPFPDPLFNGTDPGFAYPVKRVGFSSALEMKKKSGAFENDPNFWWVALFDWCFRTAHWNHLRFPSLIYGSFNI